MKDKDLIQLNHSLKYNNFSEDESEDEYQLEGSPEDYCYRGCPVCEKGYLMPEWEPMKNKSGDYVMCVICNSCQSWVEWYGGKIIYNRYENNS